MSKRRTSVSTAKELSEALQKAIEKHPAELKVLEQLIRKKIGRIPKRRRTSAQKKALIAKATGKAYFAILTSPKCRRELNTIVMTVSRDATAGGAISTLTNAGGVALPEIGIGGAAVLVLGAFVVGFIIGTYIADAIL